MNLKIFLRNWVAIIFMLLMAICLPVHSEQASASSEDRLKQLNDTMGQLIATMTERSKGYPDIIEALRQKRSSIESAETEVKKMLDDLTALADQMDVNSDYHSELSAFQNHTRDLIATVEVKNDETLKTFSDRLKTSLATFQTIEKERGAAVIQARSVIRDLYDHQENLTLIKKIGDIETAVGIFQASLGEFQVIVKTAQKLQADVVGAISTP